MSQLFDSPDYRSLMRDALLEIRQMRHALQAVETARTEPVAIIGIGCRFPGHVENPADFWHLLRAGRDAITEVPTDRWQNDYFYDANPDAPGKISTRYGGFIDNLQEFDAEFFGIADREARSIDPQQRLLLEVGWEALEQARIIPRDLASSATGVFVGISSSDYSQHLLSRSRHEIDAYLATGNSHSTAAGRLSYLLGLTGPSLAVDTACSSSLVAVHLACQSLRQQECSLALVGGVNRLISPDFSINFSKAHMLAADGRCKTFDARADGFVRAEGCGVVVLKRLSDVTAADRIWAVIRGSAVNQDGRSSGLTVPNGPAQQAVIRQAFANAGIDRVQAGYIEAHGTGTALGDPIELLALAELLSGAATDRATVPALIGSVKTNLGHLEAAAGMAGLIKAALSLHYQEIPPHLHFQQPNPHLAWEQLPLQVPTHLIPWSADRPKIAGVSSFGFSGTNAHVVLAAAPAPLESPLESLLEPLPEPPSGTLILSAKTPAALQALARRYYDYLSQNPAICFAELCQSVKKERSKFAEQLSLTASSTAEALEKLAELLNLDASLDAQPDRNNFSLDLPTYPFQRRRHWVDIQPQDSFSGSSLDDSPDAFLNSPSIGAAVHPLLGRQLSLSRSQDIYFTHRLSCASPSFLTQHQVLGTVILPASGYIEMALAAGKQVLQSDDLSLHHLSIQQPLILTDAEIAVQIVLMPQIGGRYRFEILSQALANAAWQLHASGLIAPAEADEPTVQEPNCPETICPTDYYQTLKTYGIEYGHLFQAIQQLWRGDAQALGQIQLTADLSTAAYQCHPVWLDAAFQVIGAALPSTHANDLYLPVGCERLTLYKRPEASGWSHVRLYLAEQLTADLQITDASGEILVKVEGLHLRKAQRIAAQTAIEISDAKISDAKISESWQDWLYHIEWLGQPFPTLPKPAEMREQLQPKLSEWSLQPEVVAYPALLAELERISLAYISQAFQQLGGTAAPSIAPSISASELAQRLGVVPQHQRLLHRLLEIWRSAADQGEYNLETFQSADIPASTSTNIAAQLAQLQQSYPTATAELTLLQRCGSRLADLLRGQCDPIQLLFPQGDLTAATQLYQTSTGAALMNRLVQQAVELALQAGRSLKILEIGAGTGGTTAVLLPHLSDTVEYTFTDLSPLFLQKAQQRFSAYSFVQYKVLDIERSPELQGFDLSSYDLIVAANVLHATPDLRQSLRHTRQLLAPGGLLLLLEGTRPQIWLDLIFGITEGWWRFTDRDLRPAYPLVGVAIWQQLLQDCGFEQPEAISPDGTTTNADAAPQSLFIAKAAQPPARWLIFADRQGLGQQLATGLAAGLATGLAQVTLVQAGETYHQDDDKIRFTINPAHRADFEQLWAAIPPPDQILYLWGLNSLISASLESLTAAAETACTSLLHLLQTIQSSPNLSVVTQGAVALQAETLNAAGLSQSPLWGFSKVIALEYPALHCRCIDLDPNSSPLEQAEPLQRELQSNAADHQIALRRRQRSVARLARLEPEVTLPNQPYRLACSQRGALDQLTLQPTERRSPLAGEVEIRIVATGLNLIDVLDTLNLLPFERDWFGVECAGEITAVGAEVTEFQLGDAVVALAAGSFSQYVTVAAALVAPKPDSLSFAEAATLPAAFLTADYALRLANLQPGERILIHAAATGTGMAAVILAQQLGAAVFATASPSKWPVLAAMGLQNIMNSRSLDFAEQVMTLTQGAGVDVVFNSLSGEYIPASLSVLSDQGRFLEIGKRQVWTAAQVAERKPNVAYYLIDLMAVAQQHPDQIQARLRHLMQASLQPLPQTVFPIQKVVQAFRTMQQAQHIGKIVVTQSQNPNAGRFIARADGAYLLTGGLGGLGLATAEWLVQKGARHLVLVSRSLPTSAQTQILRTLEQAGAQIQVRQADVTNRSQLASVLEALHLPLYGVFHAAGVLDDGVIQQLTWERISSVIAPKLAGAWNLHCLTQDQPLDYFVLFSSAAALLGSPGQASHVAANSFLDALAHYRQANQQPALSVNWGAWSEIGAAARQQVDQQMQRLGIGAIDPPTGLHILERLLEQSAAQVGVIPIQWSQFLQQGDRSSLLSSFAREASVQADENPAPSQLLIQLAAADSARRLSLLTAYLQTELGTVLGLPKHRLPRSHQGFFDLGMDSLMAVELKNRLESQLSISLTTTAIFEHSTIHELAEYLSTVLAPTQDLQPEPGQQDFVSLKPLSQGTELENSSLAGEITHDIESEILNELQAIEALLSKS